MMPGGRVNRYLGIVGCRAADTYPVPGLPLASACVAAGDRYGEAGKSQYCKQRRDPIIQAAASSRAVQAVRLAAPGNLTGIDRWRLPPARVLIVGGQPPAGLVPESRHAVHQGEGHKSNNQCVANCHYAVSKGMSGGFSIHHWWLQEDGRERHFVV